MNIGVLALQGAFALHRAHIEALGTAAYTEVLHPRHLARVDGLILPGGESSVMLSLLAETELLRPLTEFLKHRPAWGICAGAILLARSVCNPAQFSFKALDIAIERNSYGRQRESRVAMIEGYEVCYIRAPKIVSQGPGVRVLAQREGFATWVAQGHHMATTFHPELNEQCPSPWHVRFHAQCLTKLEIRSTLE